MIITGVLALICASLVTFALPLLFWNERDGNDE